MKRSERRALNLALRVLAAYEVEDTTDIDTVINLLTPLAHPNLCTNEIIHSNKEDWHRILG